MITIRNSARTLIVAVLGAIAVATAEGQSTPPDTTHRTAGAKAKLAPAVLRANATVKPASFTGKCPATLHWTAQLTVRNPPVTVRYEWLRSDKAKGEEKEVIVRKTEWTIGGESWQLGGDKERMHVWERLHVIAPNQLLSQIAGVNIACK